MAAHASIRRMNKGTRRVAPGSAFPHRRPWLVSTFLLFGLCLLTGCLSLRSVSATALIGTWIPARAPATRDLLLYCDAENLLAGLHTAAPCKRDEVQAALSEIEQYSKVLGEYALALKNLAEHNDYRSADPARTLVWNLQRVSSYGALSLDPASVSMQQGAASIVAMLTEEWRRHKLEQVIKETHPHIVALCQGLLHRTNLLGEPARALVQNGLSVRLRNLLLVEQSLTHSDPQSRQQRQAQLLALLLFQHTLTQSYDALLLYKKSVHAFLRGHEILYDSVTQNRSLRSHDKEILAQLSKDLPPLFQ